jgi:hypothetical protein
MFINQYILSIFSIKFLFIICVYGFILFINLKKTTKYFMYEGNMEKLKKVLSDLKVEKATILIEK